jgi:predicted secreted protein
VGTSDILTSMPTKDNTFDTSQSNFVVASSSTFFITIKSNPTTGYVWMLYSPSPLQVSACTFTQNISPAVGMVGVGGE